MNLHSLRPELRTAALLACTALLLVVAWPFDAAAHTVARKCGRGLAAMTTSFLEVPGNIVKVSHARGPIWGATLGFVQSLGMLVVRPLVGVYEFVSSPFPAPPGYQPIIAPEFPWGYFD